MNLPAHGTPSPDPIIAPLRETTHANHWQQHYLLAQTKRRQAKPAQTA